MVTAMVYNHNDEWSEWYSTTTAAAAAAATTTTATTASATATTTTTTTTTTVVLETFSLGIEALCAPVLKNHGNMQRAMRVLQL
jgi:hypothetical protein